MSAIVDFTYYTGTYKGQEADATSFPALYAHASRIVGAIARWQVTEDNLDTFPEYALNLYRLAICAQIDFLAVNGLDSVNDTGGAGFTVGKVTVHGRASTGSSGAMSASISPAAQMYLEQSGFMYPGVPVVGGCVC